MNVQKINTAPVQLGASSALPPILSKLDIKVSKVTKRTPLSTNKLMLNTQNGPGTMPLSKSSSTNLTSSVIIKPVRNQASLSATVPSKVLNLGEVKITKKTVQTNDPSVDLLEKLKGISFVKKSTPGAHGQATVPPPTVNKQKIKRKRQCEEKVNLTSNVTLKKGASVQKAVIANQPRQPPASKAKSNPVQPVNDKENKTPKKKATPNEKKTTETIQASNVNMKVENNSHLIRSSVAELLEGLDSSMSENILNYLTKNENNSVNPTMEVIRHSSPNKTGLDSSIQLLKDTPESLVECSSFRAENMSMQESPKYATLEPKQHSVKMPDAHSQESNVSELDGKQNADIEKKDNIVIEQSEITSEAEQCDAQLIQIDKKDLTPLAKEVGSLEELSVVKDNNNDQQSLANDGSNRIASETDERVDRVSNDSKSVSLSEDFKTNECIIPVNKFESPVTAVDDNNDTADEEVRCLTEKMENQLLVENSNSIKSPDPSNHEDELIIHKNFASSDGISLPDNSYENLCIKTDCPNDKDIYCNSDDSILSPIESLVDNRTSSPGIDNHKANSSGSTIKTPNSDALLKKHSSRDSYYTCVEGSWSSTKTPVSNKSKSDIPSGSTSYATCQESSNRSTPTQEKCAFVTSTPLKKKNKQVERINKTQSNKNNSNNGIVAKRKVLKSKATLDKKIARCYSETKTQHVNKNIKARPVNRTVQNLKSPSLLSLSLGDIKIPSGVEISIVKKPKSIDGTPNSNILLPKLSEVTIFKKKVPKIQPDIARIFKKYPQVSIMVKEKPSPIPSFPSKRPLPPSPPSSARSSESDCSIPRKNKAPKVKPKQSPQPKPAPKRSVGNKAGPRKSKKVQGNRTPENPQWERQNPPPTQDSVRKLSSFLKAPDGTLAKFKMTKVENQVNLTHDFREQLPTKPVRENETTNMDLTFCDTSINLSSVIRQSIFLGSNHDNDESEVFNTPKSLRLNDTVESSCQGLNKMSRTDRTSEPNSHMPEVNYKPQEGQTPMSIQGSSSGPQTEESNDGSVHSNDPESDEPVEVFFQRLVNNQVDKMTNVVQRFQISESEARFLEKEKDLIHAYHLLQTFEDQLPQRAVQHLESLIHKDFEPLMFLKQPQILSATRKVLQKTKDDKLFSILFQFYEKIKTTFGYTTATDFEQGFAIMVWQYRKSIEHISEDSEKIFITSMPTYVMSETQDPYFPKT